MPLLVSLLSQGRIQRIQCYYLFFKVQSYKSIAAWTDRTSLYYTVVLVRTSLNKIQHLYTFCNLKVFCFPLDDCIISYFRHSEKPLVFCRSVFVVFLSTLVLYHIYTSPKNLYFLAYGDIKN